MRACVLLPALVLAATSATAQDIAAVPAGPDDAIPAPVILSVEPFDGPESPDRQAFVIITFEPVASATSYLVWREVELNYTLDESGELVPLDVPEPTFIPWGRVDAIPGERLLRAVVAVLDGDRGRWGLSTEVVRDGKTYRSPISPFPDSPVPTAVLQAGWGHIKNLGRHADVRGSR